MSFDNDNATFQVVINHEEQYSIWPDFKEVPTGWRKVGVQGTKQVCLDYIEQVWTDMRPLSLRQALGEAPGASPSAHSSTVTGG